MSDWDELVFQEMSVITDQIKDLLEKSGQYNALGMAAALSVTGEMMIEVLERCGEDGGPTKKDIQVISRIMGILDQEPHALTLLLAQLSKMLAKMHFETLPKGQS